jgi:hypothetical protein
MKAGDRTRAETNETNRKRGFRRKKGRMKNETEKGRESKEKAKRERSHTERSAEREASLRLSARQKAEID